MEAFLTYLVRAAAVTAVFYLFYKILLVKETFHRINRAVLLCSALLSFILPLCILTVHRTIYMDSSLIVDTSSLTFVTTSTTAGFDWITAGVIVYLVGVAAVIVAKAFSVFSIRRILRQGRTVERGKGYRVVITDRKVSPFSWFGNIVMTEEDYAQSGTVIIAHEMAHIRLRHSADLLVVSLCCAAEWFNPAMWLLVSDLKEIHEYEADEEVLRSGIDAKTYQLLLIKKAVGDKSYSIANSLNHSTLKNRITMMLSKKSNVRSRLKLLYVIPLVCTSLAAFARTETSVIDIADRNGKDNKKPLVEQSVAVENNEIAVVVKQQDEKKKTKKAEKSTSEKCVIKISQADSTTIATVGTATKFTISSDGDAKDSKELNGLIYRVEMPTKQTSGDTYHSSTIYFVNGNRVSSIDDISTDDITSITVLKGDKAEAKYGEEGKNGAIEITSSKPFKPIYIIDGQEVNGIGDIDSDDIASITVYKDKAAVKKYGKKAEGGVIEITTKKGSAK